MADAKVTVFCDIACHLGEGPAYHPATDTLYWFDIVERRLLERRMEGARTRIHPLPEMASAIAFTRDGRQIVVTETGIKQRDPLTGNLVLIAALEDDKPANRSNDARVHPSGAFWIGTMGKNAEKGAGAIYWFRAGEIRLLFAGITIPNSICFSPDGSAAYYADTADRRLLRVSCDAATGLPYGTPEVFMDGSRLNGGIDGSVTDAEGNVWNAEWGGGRLVAYSPGGRELREIRMPVGQPSCPAFVGQRADRIAVTSAWQGLDPAGRSSDPGAGRTLVVETPVNGRFDACVVA